MNSTLQIKFNKRASNKESKLSIFWMQGEFYFKNSTRVATVTDVKFISNKLLIIAIRDTARLYLVEITNKGYKIIREKKLRVKFFPSKKRFFHPDLISIEQDKIYISDYTNRCAVFNLKKNKISFDKILNFSDNSFHGCYIENGLLYLGAVNNGVIQVYNINTNLEFIIKIKNNGLFSIEENIRIKTINKYNDLFVLGIDISFGDTREKNDGGDSWVGLFEENNQSLECLDIIKYKNTQLDGCSSKSNAFYFSIHEAEVNKGKILVYEINKDNKLKLKHSVYCKAFPHGLDVLDDKIAYTSYKESLVEILDLDLFYKSDDITNL